MIWILGFKSSGNKKLDTISIDCDYDSENKIPFIILALPCPLGLTVLREVYIFDQRSFIEQETELHGLEAKGKIQTNQE